MSDQLLENTLLCLADSVIIEFNRKSKALIKKHGKVKSRQLMVALEVSIINKAFKEVEPLGISRINFVHFIAVRNDACEGIKEPQEEVDFNNYTRKRNKVRRWDDCTDTCNK